MSIAIHRRRCAKYSRPAARTCAGVVEVAAVEHERRLERAGCSSSKSGLRNSFHSVTTTSASAPSHAASGDARVATRAARRRTRGAPRPWRPGRTRRCVAPRASSASTITRDGASRMSSVLGLKARPHSANVRPERSSPSRATILSTSTLLLRVVDRLDRRDARVSGRPNCVAPCTAAPSRPSESSCRRSRRRDRGSDSRCAGPSRCPGAPSRCRRRAGRRGSRARS